MEEGGRRLREGQSKDEETRKHSRMRRAWRVDVIGEDLEQAECVKTEAV